MDSQNPFHPFNDLIDEGAFDERQAQNFSAAEGNVYLRFLVSAEEDGTWSFNIVTPNGGVLQSKDGLLSIEAAEKYAKNIVKRYGLRWDKKPTQAALRAQSRVKGR